MAYFAVPYRVLFHDTMAYGSHHHMANFKFQNVARETLLFTSGQEEGWQRQLDAVLLLTREAYSFNLAPVGLGEQVCVLMTYEAPTRSTVRVCFRTVRADGVPVSCGYQTLLVLDRKTHQLVPAPPILQQFTDPSNPYSLIEPLAEPSFAERLRADAGRAAKAIFTEAVCTLARQVASAPPPEAYPRILDDALYEYAP